MNIKQSKIDEVISLAQKSDVQKMIIFGSRARGDNKARSDIDLAVSGGNSALFRTEIDDYGDTLLMFDIVDLDGAIQDELLQVIKKERIVFYEIN